MSWKTQKKTIICKHCKSCLLLLYPRLSRIDIYILVNVNTVFWDIKCAASSWRVQETSFFKMANSTLN